MHQASSWSCPACGSENLAADGACLTCDRPRDAGVKWIEKSSAYGGRSRRIEKRSSTDLGGTARTRSLRTSEASDIPVGRSTDSSTSASALGPRATAGDTIAVSPSPKGVHLRKLLNLIPALVAALVIGSIGGSVVGMLAPQTRPADVCALGNAQRIPDSGSLAITLCSQALARNTLWVKMRSGATVKVSFAPSALASLGDRLDGARADDFVRLQTDYSLQDSVWFLYVLPNDEAFHQRGLRDVPLDLQIEYWREAGQSASAPASAGQPGEAMSSPTQPRPAANQPEAGLDSPPENPVISPPAGELPSPSPPPAPSALSTGLPAAAAPDAQGGVRPAQLHVCPSNLRFHGSTTFLSCLCPEGSFTGRVWGGSRGLYTDDSSICMAARQAGVVAASGGSVLVTAAPGQGSYEGISRNGVNSFSYGPWTGSFTVTSLSSTSPAAARPQTTAVTASPEASAAGSSGANILCDLTAVDDRLGDVPMPFATCEARGGKPVLVPD